MGFPPGLPSPSRKPQPPASGAGSAGAAERPGVLEEAAKVIAAGAGAATTPAPKSTPAERAQRGSETRIHALRLLLTLGLCALITALEIWAPAAPWRAWICLALASVALSLGGDVIHNSLRAFSLAKVNGDSLAALGALAAFFGGTAAATLWSLGRLSSYALPHGGNSGHQGLTLGLGAGLLLLALSHAGRCLEGMARRAAAREILALKDLRPSRARMISGHAETEVPVEQVEEGSRVLVPAGERVPLDGLVLEGKGAVDETILGAREPVIKKQDKRVYAGTLNGPQPLTIRTIAPGAGCAWHRALDIALDCQFTPCPRSQGESWASFGLCAVGVIASVLLAGALWEEGFGYGPSLTAALALLAAAWPGPVLVAGNAAAQSGIGWLAGRGVVLRSLAVVSCIARARTAFFAKTGTLTYGHPQVAEVVPLKEGKEPEDILFLATVLEVRSEHQIAEGILGAGGGQRRTIPALRGFRAIPGKGLRAQYKGKETLFGNLPLLADAGIDVAPAQRQHDAMAGRGLTPLTLSWGGELMGLVGMVDEERHGARQSIAELREMGLRCVVLTGDCSPTAEALVQNLQMDGAIAGLSLLGKAEVVRAEKARGRVPLAIGHGLADASALGAAEVGIALGAADDLVLDAAQGLVLGSDPRAVSWLVHSARRARAASRRALALALGLCSTVLGIFAFQAAAGRPLPAFAAALSTLTATFAASYLAGSWVRGGPEPGGEANGKSAPKL